MSFLFHKLDVPDVVRVEARVFPDERGFFMETYKASEFEANGIPERFVQDNCSHSVRNVIRGLHYQKHPKAQGKLVMVIRGEIFDVAVDLRRGSPSYGRWVGEFLSAANRRMLYVPIGFAHGFCSLSEEADVVYKVTEEYSPELDRGVIWNDPDLGIRWPVEAPIVSDKDAGLPRLEDAEHNFVYGGRA